MRAFWHRMSGVASTILRVLVIFAVVRLAFGVVAIAFLSDDSLAYSLGVTGILAAAAAIGLTVAIVVRAYHRPQRPTHSD